MMLEEKNKKLPHQDQAVEYTSKQEAATEQAATTAIPNIRQLQKPSPHIPA